MKASTAGRCSSAAWGRGARSATSSTRAYVPKLIGKDPRNVEAIWQGLRRTNRHMYNVTDAIMGAIDVALWDLRGKALGVPIAELLGLARTRIPTYATARTWDPSPEDVFNEATHAQGGGLPRLQDPVLGRPRSRHPALPGRSRGRRPRLPADGGRRGHVRLPDRDRGRARAPAPGLHLVRGAHPRPAGRAAAPPGRPAGHPDPVHGDAPIGRAGGPPAHGCRRHRAGRRAAERRCHRAAQGAGDLRGLRLDAGDPCHRVGAPGHREPARGPVGGELRLDGGAEPGVRRGRQGDAAGHRRGRLPRPARRARPGGGDGLGLDRRPHARRSSAPETRPHEPAPPRDRRDGPPHPGPVHGAQAASAGGGERRRARDARPGPGVRQGRDALPLGRVVRGRAVWASTCRTCSLLRRAPVRRSWAWRIACRSSRWMRQRTCRSQRRSTWSRAWARRGSAAGWRARSR